MKLYHNYTANKLNESIEKINIEISNRNREIDNLKNNIEEFAIRATHSFIKEDLFMSKGVKFDVLNAIKFKNVNLLVCAKSKHIYELLSKAFFIFDVLPKMD